MEVQTNSSSKASKKTGGKGKKKTDETPLTETQEDSNVVVKEVPPEVPLVKNVSTNEADDKSNIQIEGENILNKPSDEEVLATISTMKINIDTILEYAKTIKDIELSNDVLKEIFSLDKDLKKASTTFSNNFSEILVKSYKSSNKTKTSKKAKKEKESVNKDKYAVNKKSKPLEFVSKFMEIDSNAEISQGEVLRALNAYISVEKKEKKNPEIFVEGKNSMFKVYGKLKPFFDSIYQEMKARSHPLSEKPFPTELGYKDLMTYNKFCFPPKEKK